MKNPFRSIRVFSAETITELKKATWPTRKELKDYTLIVIVGVLILGAFISTVDFSLYQVVQLLTSMVSPS